MLDYESIVSDAQSVGLGAIVDGQIQRIGNVGTRTRFHPTIG
jgi:hypothetical protein